jgi:tetratricopeptide (TPR) repeat protein
MKHPLRHIALIVGLVFTATASAITPKTKPDTKMPMTGLAPAKLVPGLCVVRYRVTTTSPECQAFFDQGLGYLYSYVWMESARSFETATHMDPDCAMAWWGLSRALDRWHGVGRNPIKPLKKAHELLPHASYCEQQLILARAQEKGLIADLRTGEARKKAAIDTIDKLLSQYDDDEEAWFYRAQLGGGSDLFGGQVSAVPFYKALVRVNPLHPGANHELLHFYERCQRPALGWKYAEAYIQSSPLIPHAFHMQAHLATRLGRWDKTSDRSRRAVELERAYHKEMNVRPRDDQQFSHHLEVLTLSLIHDGRFREARDMVAEAKACDCRHWLPWSRLYLAARDWAGLGEVIEHFRKDDKVTASYLTALMYLARGETARARPDVEVLQEAFRKNKDDAKLQFRLWETQGVLMCRTGDVDAGLKLLAKAVERSKNDYSHHSWGNGAYYMEEWGSEALRARKNDVAEEAFLEALAHDPGSVRGALGMQVLCERQGRAEEAARYVELARRCWGRAAPADFKAQLATLQETNGVENKAARVERN